MSVSQELSAIEPEHFLDSLLLDPTEVPEGLEYERDVAYFSYGGFADCPASVAMERFSDWNRREVTAQDDKTFFLEQHVGYVDTGEDAAAAIRTISEIDDCGSGSFDDDVELEIVSEVEIRGSTESVVFRGSHNEGTLAWAFVSIDPGLVTTILVAGPESTDQVATVVALAEKITSKVPTFLIEVERCHNGMYDLDSRVRMSLACRGFPLLFPADVSVPPFLLDSEARRQAILDAEEAAKPGVIWIVVTRATGERHNDRESVYFDKSGQAIRIDGRASYSGPAQHSTWTITPNGYARVRAEIARLELDGRGADGYSAPLGAIWIEDEEIYSTFDGLSETDGADERDRQLRENFLLLWEELAEPAWFGADLLEPERPWVPDRIAFQIIEVPPGESDDAVEWPFDRTVVDMVTREVGEGDVDEDEFFPVGSELICLEGDDAATAWAPLFTDDNYDLDTVVSDDTLYVVEAYVPYPDQISQLIFNYACPTVG